MAFTSGSVVYVELRSCGFYGTVRRSERGMVSVTPLVVARARSEAVAVVLNQPITVWASCCSPASEAAVRVCRERGTCYQTALDLAPALAPRW